jgi:outer membrane protein TolC
MTKFLTFYLVLFTLQYSLADETRPEITLTQQGVADLILKQGQKTQEVHIKYKQFRLGPAQALSAFDWKLSADSGYDFDKSVSLLTSFTQNKNKYDRYKTTLNLQKPFTSGTVLGVELSRLSQKAEYDSTITTPLPTVQTLDYLGFTLEQSLLNNFGGQADKGNINSAELTFEANNILHANELEDVVLQAIRQFWITYVAQENHKEAINSRDRYKKLVDAVKKKTSLGYSNPGDLPQVQAEFETREQRVRSASADFMSNLENLRTLLSLDPKAEIKFEVPKTLDIVPQLPTKKVEDLREIRSQKLKVAASEETLKSAESISHPTLNFVAKAYSYGVDKSSDDSFTQMASANRPKYYAGIKFQYNFGSDFQSENILNKRLIKNLEEVRLQRQISELKDREQQAERKVQTTYAIALSSEKQKSFREKAAQELNTSYTQGRTDISLLINTLNNFFDSEIQYTRAIGEYAIALNEWAAIRDELIPDEKPITKDSK